MADITWSIFANANFSPEELECAQNGGTWNRADQTCTVARPLPPAEPLLPAVGSQGTVDPQQMQDDGFVYIGGQWVRWDSAAARGLGVTSASSGGRPASASVLPGIASGSVLGYDIPAASPVALPSFVGGLLGVVRLGGGMRPASGGDPQRVVMGNPTYLPRVRMIGDVLNWGR